MLYEISAAKKMKLHDKEIPNTQDGTNTVNFEDPQPTQEYFVLVAFEIVSQLRSSREDPKCLFRRILKDVDCSPETLISDYACTSYCFYAKLTPDKAKKLSETLKESCLTIWCITCTPTIRIQLPSTSLIRIQIPSTSFSSSLSISSLRISTIPSLPCISTKLCTLSPHSIPGPSFSRLSPHTTSTTSCVSTVSVSATCGSITISTCPTLKPLSSRPISRNLSSTVLRY